MTELPTAPISEPTESPLRRRSVRVRVAVLVAAAVIGMLAALTGEPRAGDASTDGTASADGSTDGDAAETVPASLGLLAHRRADGLLDFVVLVGVDEGGETGAGVLVPPPTLIEVPSLGSIMIEELGAGRDTVALANALANAFGVRLDATTVFDDDALVAALAPATALDVDLHRPIRIEDDRGTLTFPAGPQEITAADAMRLLTADTDEGELDRLVVVQAVLDGWADALGDEDVLWPTIALEPGLAPLARFGASEGRWSTLPVNRLLAAPDDEIYGIERADVADLMSEAFGWALLGDGSARPRVELLNGTGGVGVTSAVAELVVPAGGEVTLTGNVPGFGVTETKVVYYRPEGRAAAEMVLEALGTGTLALADQPLGVVDVTVVIGEDLVGAAPVDGDVEGVEAPASVDGEPGA